MDLAPLRHREFRLLFTAQTVSITGSMLTYVALPFQTYALTGSSLAVGLIGAAEIVPLVVVALLAGALADAVDRRRLVMIAEGSAAVVAAALALNATLDHPRLWVLYVCAVLAAGCYAVLRPPLDALVPRLVPRDEQTAAMALETVRYDAAQIAGPAAAGVLIAAAGVVTTYWIDAASFAVSLLVLAAMRATPPPEDAERVSLRSIAEGFRYARSRQELLGTYLVDMNAMFFGMPIALFPAIAQRFGGPGVLGLLYAAPAVGSLAAALTSGWASRVTRHGRTVALAAGGYGVAIVLFGVADALWLALLGLALAGAADAISGIFRSTMWNQTIPDRLRGRLAGIEMISWSSGPTLGNVESGAVASLAGVRASVVSGGALCVAGTLALALALPRFWRYDRSDHDREVSSG